MNVTQPIALNSMDLAVICRVNSSNDYIMPDITADIIIIITMKQTEVSKKYKFVISSPILQWSVTSVSPTKNLGSQSTSLHSASWNLGQ